MWYAILTIISIGAMILGQVARTKVERILVTQTLTLSEEYVKVLGLYPRLALRLSRAEEKDMVQVWVTDAAGQDVLLGQYSSPLEYDILKKKVIHASIYSIYGGTVVVEIKLNEAL